MFKVFYSYPRLDIQNIERCIENNLIFFNVLNEFLAVLEEMAQRKDTWTESRISQDLREFFKSFTFEIPEDTTNLSFAMELLEGTPVDEFESDIKSLSKEVVFHRSIRKEDIRPGTVFVCEVDAKLEGCEVVIKEEVVYNFILIF